MNVKSLVEYASVKYSLTQYHRNAMLNNNEKGV
jgi:hypothetical protein